MNGPVTHSVVADLTVERLRFAESKEGTSPRP